MSVLVKHVFWYKYTIPLPAQASIPRPDVFLRLKEYYGQIKFDLLLLGSKIDLKIQFLACSPDL
jgi:hypothetical protein